MSQPWSLYDRGRLAITNMMSIHAKLKAPQAPSHELLIVMPTHGWCRFGCTGWLVLNPAALISLGRFDKSAAALSDVERKADLTPMSLQ
jgi:hypothetical protein